MGSTRLSAIQPIDKIHMKKNPVSLLRRVALAEAVSYLLLLGVAMPLKYAFGLPQAVMVVGWIHGALFVVFGVALLLAWFGARWPFLRVAGVFVASLIPLVPFFIDRKMAAYEEEAGARIGS